MKEEVKAGTIVVVSLVILSAFIILIGGGRLFDDYDKYQVHVMNAGGLEVGAQVRLGGVRIGRILSIKPPAGPGKRLVNPDWLGPSLTSGSARPDWILIPAGYHGWAAWCTFTIRAARK